MRSILSICIPSYNRPKQIVDLLASIDCDVNDIEVVICEDKSPLREKIRENVNTFLKTSPYKILYVENKENLGYDGNLRRLIELATGKFVMYMGDDDLFVPKALDSFLQFLRENEQKKYILRSYLVIHPDGEVESFHYLPGTTVLAAGEETVAWLFKRSVTICGFTISRDEALKFSTSDLDGTLLYQVYLMAQVCLFHESIYCHIPVVQAVQSFRDDKPNFCAASAEKGRYSPGVISPENSINFTKAYFELSDYLDKQHGTRLSEKIREGLSKYSYPFLSIQRKRGVGPFLQYAKRLEVEMGFGCTYYFYVYKWMLVVFGERICDRMILRIKNVIGHAPNF